MVRRREFGPVIRACLVMVAVGILVSGVTYAALQSANVSLTGNRIETGSADLQIGLSDTAYSTSVAGFTFAGTIPGGAAAPVAGNTFYLKNNGVVPLALKAQIISVPTNPNSIDLTKVNVVLTRMPSGLAQSFSVSLLMNAVTSGGLSVGDTLLPGTSAQYKIQTSMAADAFSGTSGSVSNLNLTFSGMGVSQ